MLRKWTTGIAVCLLAAAPLWGQSDDPTIERLTHEVETLRKEILRISSAQLELRRSNETLQQTNERLRSRLESGGPDVGELERSINALGEKLDAFEGSTLVSAADPVTLSGEFRARAGFISNRDFGINIADGGEGASVGSDPEDDTGTYVDARFNLAFDMALDNHVTTHFELISTGLYENYQADPSTGDLAEVDLYQGWIQFDGMFGRDELHLKTGRQEIVLGNEFQFGNNEFFGGETHDSTLLWWQQEEFVLIFVWSKLAINNTFNPANHPYPAVGAGSGFDDDEAYILYFTLNTIEHHVVDLYYAFINGHRGGSFGTLGNPIGAPFEIFAHLVGGRIAGDLPGVAAGLDYNLEVAYEFGDLQGVSVDVEGLTLEAEIGLTFSEESKFRIFGRFLFAEGGEGDESGWVPLFPERQNYGSWDDHTALRARWGIMNIIPMSNVITAQAGATFRPAPDWELGATVLAAWHDERVVTLDGTRSDDIGWEVDLFIDHRHSEQTTIGVGFGIFIPEEGAPLAGTGAAFAGDDEDDLAFLFYLQTRTKF